MVRRKVKAAVGLGLRELEPALVQVLTGRQRAPALDMCAMAEFYLTASVMDVGRDTLMARWGTYADANLDGSVASSVAYFEFDISRRVAMRGKLGRWELVIAYRLPATLRTKGLGEGAIECLQRRDLDPFLTAALALPAMRAVSTQKQPEPRVEFRCFG